MAKKRSIVTETTIQHFNLRILKQRFAISRIFGSNYMKFISELEKLQKKLVCEL